MVAEAWRKGLWKESDLDIAQDAGDLLPPASSCRLQASIRGYCQLIANIFILIQFKVQGLSISNLQFSNFDSSSSQIQFESYSLLNVGLQSLEITAAVQRGIGDKEGMGDRFVEIQHSGWEDDYNYHLILIS